MRAPTTLLLACAAALALPLALPAHAAEPVVSVPEMDLTRYAGHWYEIAHLPVSFQRRCAADITTSYALRADGRIEVRNTCRTGDGEQLQVHGTARTVPGHPGRLQVRFAPAWMSWLPWTWADYWVIELDPDYRWAMVGDPDREYLWILAREPSMDAALFARLQARAKAMGYDLAPLVVAAPLR